MAHDSTSTRLLLVGWGSVLVCWCVGVLVCWCVAMFGCVLMWMYKFVEFAGVVVYVKDGVHGSPRRFDSSVGRASD